MKYFVIAQILGIIGMGMNILSYQGEKQKSVIIMQFFSSLFFSVNMLMLRATMGCLLNIIGIFRALVYVNKDKFKHIGIANVVFMFLFVLSYIATFTIFKKEPSTFNIIVEILPLIAMFATTIGFSKKDAKSIRRMALISSPLWLIYDLINMSLGGVVCETLSLISVVIGMFRYDIQRGK